MTQSVRKVMMALLFLCIAMFAWGQVWQQSFATAPTGWTLSDAHWSFNSTSGSLRFYWQPTLANYDCTAISPVIALPANAGDLTVEQCIDDDTSADDNEIMEVIAVVNGSDVVLWSYNTQTNHDLGTTTAHNSTVVSLAAYAGQNIQLKFRSHGGSTYNINAWYIYNLSIAGSFNNDLAAVSVTGNVTPSVGAVTPYVVTVRNNGTAAQSNYTVKLMTTGDVEVATVAGTALAAGTTTTFNMNWTPSTVGATTLYAKVVFAADEVPANNTTANLNVVVQAAGTTAVTVGSGTLLERMPIDVYWYNSICEMIYYPAELNVAGQINAVQFYNNFVSTNTLAKPTKIWMGETTQTDLSAGWIPSSSLQLVFDGTVDYPVGNNTINIPLTTPYTYSGGNLVVMAYRPRDTVDYSSSDKFYAEDTPAYPNRTRNVYADTDTFDPANPPATHNLMTVSSKHPNITFFMQTGPHGTLAGTVTGASSAPLAGATVTVAGSPVSQTTDATGHYAFNYVTTGAHQVTVAAHGYVDQTQSVTISDGQNATLNFTMVQLPTVTVTGRVVGNDNPNVGIADATISFTGYAPYTATTNASGNFTINGVYANQTYSYTIVATGYAATSGTAVVAATNLNMGDVLVTETILPPYGVTAMPQGTNMAIHWNAPDASAGGLTEGFEGTFPPTDWTTVVNEPANTWIQAETISFSSGDVAPHSGAYQAYIHFSYSAQDEWLITPQFTCPGNANLSFYTYGYVGSTNLDHYYVKVSTDGGTNWTSLWDATAIQPAGNYTYEDGPISIPMTTYAGQQIKLAWQAVDGDSEGLWHVWFLDDIAIGNGTTTVRFDSKDMTRKSAGTSVVSNHVISGGYASKNEYMMAQKGIIAQTIAPRVTAQTRALNGYKVWRLASGQETNEANWTLVTPTMVAVPTTDYLDTTWSTVTSGTYKYAVKAIYSANVASSAAFSNEVMKDMTGTITGTVKRADNQQAISGATVTAGTYSATTNAQGVYTLENVMIGSYTVTATAMGFMSASVNNVQVIANQSTTANLQLEASQIMFEDSFETYEDFSLDMSPWVMIDGDQGSTYGFSGITFTNALSPMAFICFNPSSTSPAMNDDMVPHTGNKIAACFASTPSTADANNDWLITPAIDVPAGRTVKVTFYAMSFDATYLEDFNVGYSMGGSTQSDFTMIANVTSVPADGWVEYNYTLPGTVAGNSIRFAIQCVSVDKFILMVDDFKVEPVLAGDDLIAAPLTTSLVGNYPNPFNPSTTIKYSLKSATPVKIEIFNTKGQKVRTLVNEVKSADNHSVIWNGRDDSNKVCGSGVYFYKMTAGKMSSTKKMIMLK